MSDSTSPIIQFLADVDDDKVYISHFAERNGLFVLRVLSPQTSARVPNGAAQLAALGNTLQTLNHPNIKHVIGQIQQDDQPALVMPYFEGQSAADFLKGGQPMPPERVVRVALELVDALNAAHHIGVYHGAIRPESVILTAHGGVILSEWGSNLILPPHWDASPYVAPELRDGAAPSSQTDIWSLGVLMYQLLTLHLPRTTDDLTRLCPTCPPTLVTLIDRMLDPDPYARPYCAILVGKTLERERPPQDRTRFTHHHETPASLPMRSSRFFGREAELAQLHSLLFASDHHIISVCGSEGSGRTTLVLEAANRFFSDRADDGWTPEHVYYVRFHPDSRPDHLMLALAVSSGIPFEHQFDALQQIIDFLSDRAALVVMDDIEHFSGGTGWLTAIADAAPRVKLVLTSVAPLGLPNEAMLSLSGLALPTDAADVEAPSVQLFAYSARRQTPDFKLTPVNLPEIVKLCRRVGGAPLSIVLAAGAVAELDIASLTEHISTALGISATADLNFARIRAVFEVAWSLISAEERDIVIRLSVVVGNISLEAAKALSGATAAHLRTLVNKGLLQRVPETGGISIHPLIHRCAQAWFSESDSTAQIWHDHSVYYLRFLEREGKRVAGAGQIEAAQAITAKLDNIRPAWHWAIEHQRFEFLDDIVESLHNFLLFGQRFDERDFWFGSLVHALEATPPSPKRDAMMAAPLFYASVLARQDLNVQEALAYLEQAEALNRAAWPLHVNVVALYARGLYETSFGNPLLGRAVFEKMLTLALYEYNPRSEMAASLYLGAAQYQRVEPERVALERGKSLLKRALELSEQSGDEFAGGVAYLHLGVIHAISKDPTTAIDLLNLGLRAALKVKSPRTAIPLLTYLSELATQQGKHDEARAATQQLIDLSRSYGHPLAVASGTISLAQLELLAGNYALARDLCHAMLLRLQADPRGQSSRAKTRCLYAYAMSCLGEYEAALEQVRVALDDLDGDRTFEIAEVWIWMAILTQWGRGPAQASAIFEAVIERHQDILSQHHRAVVYAGRAHTALELNDLDAAGVAIAEMSNALHGVVSYDYRDNTLLNIISPRIWCGMMMIYWLYKKDDIESARARMYEVIPMTIQTASPYLMLRALAMGAALFMKTEPQKAYTWIHLIIEHPRTPASLRQQIIDSFNQTKNSISPRLILAAAAHAKTLTLTDALNDLRSLL